MDSRIKRVILVCQHCGKPFQVQQYRAETAKYCSAHCRAVENTMENYPKRAKGINRVCENCGKLYYVPPKAIGTSRFCSRSCTSSFINRGEKTHLWKGGKRIRKCPRCGSEFLVNPNDKRRVYCSKSCHDIARQVRRVLTCPTCQKVFTVRRIRFAHSFCSRDCFRLYRPTTIEIVIREVIARMGIDYIPEHKIGRYYIDVFIPSANLAVECDGDYWHSTTRAKLRDARKDAFLASQGITVLRLPECDIRQKIDQCAQAIASHL